MAQLRGRSQKVLLRSADLSPSNERKAMAAAWPRTSTRPIAHSVTSSARRPTCRRSASTSLIPTYWRGSFRSAGKTTGHGEWFRLEGSLCTPWHVCGAASTTEA